MVTTHTKQWDRHEIMAEVRRRGTTLKAVALNAGLAKDGCSVALIRPFPAAEAAIAEFLNVPAAELWPDRYPAPSLSRRDPTSSATGNGSLNSKADQTSRRILGVA